ncbi:protein of unknown function DUF29 [Candidatus Magnetoovum chiemensis]|nr:protein of unknown function DUF29 [Candidatus Magnetoovum chiemensis]
MMQKRWEARKGRSKKMTKVIKARFFNGVIEPSEEIESLGKNNKRELGSRLAVLIMHLLKWQHQPRKRSKSWKTTIRTQRREIERLLEDSPSLKYGIEIIISKEFLRAKRDFEDETGISKKMLPETCPYTWEQLSNFYFLPE